jgi:Transposase, Mutator family
MRLLTDPGPSKDQLRRMLTIAARGAGSWRTATLAPAGSIDDAAPIVGSRHGHRTRTLTGTFGKTEIAVPRARIKGEDGKTSEWKSKSLRAYQRRTKQAEALIAGTYLSGTNTRRVRRALSAVFKGAVGKDVVSRTWRKVKGDWDAWNARNLKDEPIIRLILDGTIVRVRLDKKATSISLLAGRAGRWSEGASRRIRPQFLPARRSRHQYGGSELHAAVSGLYIRPRNIWRCPVPNAASFLAGRNAIYFYFG